MHSPLVDRSQAQLDEVKDITFRGVLRLMKGYVAPPDWLDQLRANAAELGLAYFDEITDGVERWMRSRTRGNPHGLTEDEILACGLYTYDLGITAEPHDVRGMHHTFSFPPSFACAHFCDTELFLCVQQCAAGA